MSTLRKISRQALLLKLLIEEEDKYGLGDHQLSGTLQFVSGQCGDLADFGREMTAIDEAMKILKEAYPKNPRIVEIVSHLFDTYTGLGEFSAKAELEAWSMTMPERAPGSAIPISAILAESGEERDISLKENPSDGEPKLGPER